MGSSLEVTSSHELMHEHWDEIVKRKNLFKVNPDNSAYEYIEKSGNSFTLICEIDNKIVGYSINIMHPNLHFKDVMMCDNDVIFVSKKYRNTSIGIKLIKETERIAKEKGCDIMAWHAKPNTPLAKILPRLNNSLHEHIFTKEL